MLVPIHLHRAPPGTDVDRIRDMAAVALGAILGAVETAGRSLADQRIVVLGAGAAAVRMSDALCAALTGAGLDEEEARRRLWLVDAGGLLHSGRRELTPEQGVYAQPASRVAGWAWTRGGRVGLSDVVARVEATILVGASGAGGAFTESVVRQMARTAQRPIILPLSTPASRSEATPEDLFRWTEGRALVATGAPFAPVRHCGGAIPIAECNPAYVSPGIRLALAASGARRVTDGMLLAASRELAAHSAAASDASGSLLPPLAAARSLVADVATAVAVQAQRDGVAPPFPADELGRRIRAARWTPRRASCPPDEARAA